MRLTKNEKDLISRANIESDFCCRGHYRTMASLVNKDLAIFTSGFGWKYGGLIELTLEGKKILKKINDLKRLDRILDADSIFDKRDESGETNFIVTQGDRLKAFLQGRY